MPMVLQFVKDFFDVKDPNRSINPGKLWLMVRPYRQVSWVVEVVRTCHCSK